MHVKYLNIYHLCAFDSMYRMFQLTRMIPETNENIKYPD